MSAIQFPVLPQNTNYCAVSDVLNLIGGVAPIVNGTCTQAQITQAITQATRWMEYRTNKFFSPRRLIKQYDGNGHTRMVLPDGPLISVNVLKVFFTYPLAVSRIAHDWDLLIDRAGSVISFPTFIDSPFYQPFAFTFFRSSRNVTIDAWYGFTQEVWSDVLTTEDNNQTYSFAYPTVVKQSEPSTGDATKPPRFFPVIYKNGERLENTTYTLVNTGGPTVNNIWEVDQDNIYFTFNQGASGYASITFNTPNEPGDVITADYAYWFIPEDILEATAKKAATLLLASFATSSYQDQQFQGATSIQMDGSRIQYQQGGQWGEQITDWKADIEQVIAAHKKIVMPFGIGYNDNLA